MTPSTHPVSDSKKWCLASAIIIALALLFLYGYPLMYVYAFTDVYEFLYDANRQNFFDVFIQGGRPLFGLLNKFFLTHFTTVHQLVWPRLFGTLGILAAGTCFYFILDAFFKKRILALLGAFAFMTSPGATLAGMWIATYQTGWAMALALVGGYMTSLYCSGLFVFFAYGGRAQDCLLPCVLCGALPGILSHS